MNSLVLSALPEAVSKVANGDFLGHFPVGERLLTNQRMERVWKKLRTEGIKLAQSNPEAFEKELNELPYSYRRESRDDSPPSDRFDPTPRRVTYLADSACASFFLATAIIFTFRNRTGTERDLKQEVQRWRTGAQLCREARSSPHRATVDPTLAAALALVTDYFEGHIASIETTAAGSPYFIGRNARERAPGGGKNAIGNENVRGQVCDLARITQKIFGSFLHTPVATAASVATGLPINSTTVENWSKASQKGS
jgi:hypothetical protein